MGRVSVRRRLPVSLLAPGNGKMATGWVRTYIREGRPWKGEAPAPAWHRFSANRKAGHTKSHLADFAGWMHSGDYAGFGEVARTRPIREVACLTDVQRKFFHVHATQGSAIAAETLERIVTLHAIEKEARGQLPERCVAIRLAGAALHRDECERWLHSQLPKIFSKTPLAAAIPFSRASVAVFATACASPPSGACGMECLATPSRYLVALGLDLHDLPLNEGQSLPRPYNLMPFPRTALQIHHVKLRAKTRHPS